MQTLIGFWAFLRPNNMLGGHYAVYYADNGFGELIPSPCPVYAIETANQ